MRHHKIVISPTAQNMIKEHVYFLSQVNLNAAKRLKKEIISSIRGLAQMPERFPYLDLEKPEPDYRKMLVADRYLVLYLVENDTVYVEYVVDGRQDYMWLLP